MLQLDASALGSCRAAVAPWRLGDAAPYNGRAVSTRFRP